MSPKPIACFFPGQGSQSVGMLNALAAAFRMVGETFAEASDALGLDLWRLASEGPQADLDRTENTQPAMLATGVAVWRVWCESGGPAAAVMAGHSLGEYSALVAAGAIPFVEAIRLAADRARYMQEAVPVGQGAMAAILGLDDDRVVAICAEQAQGEVLSAVNFNCPEQVVIAGAAAAVERATAAAKAAGAKRALILPVSVPSHCALMEPAAERLAERLAGIEIRVPDCPVIHNVDLGESRDAQSLRGRLIAQLHSPVRWVETVQAVADHGIAQAIECGPGKVLTGLNKRIAKGFSTWPVYDPQTLEAALGALEETSADA
jgi:[acyl-carrier-protein] S-malonyltransferase